MNTLVSEPIPTIKVQSKNYSFPEVLSSLQIVLKNPIETAPNLNEASDLFKNNADFVAHGLSSMMNLS